jgi:prevent-host-death family protein
LYRSIQFAPLFECINIEFEIIDLQATTDKPQACCDSERQPANPPHLQGCHWGCVSSQSGSYQGASPPSKNLIKTKISFSYFAGAALMKLSTHIKPISYLKSHTAQIVKELTESREPMVITQNGEATLVVIDVKSFEERENTLALLKILALGSRELELGKYQDAEDVFANIDKSDLQ